MFWDKLSPLDQVSGSLESCLLEILNSIYLSLESTSVWYSCPLTILTCSPASSHLESSHPKADLITEPSD